MGPRSLHRHRGNWFRALHCMTVSVIEQKCFGKAEIARFDRLSPPSGLASASFANSRRSITAPFRSRRCARRISAPPSQLCGSAPTRRPRSSPRWSKVRSRRSGGGVPMAATTRRCSTIWRSIAGNSAPGAASPRRSTNGEARTLRGGTAFLMDHPSPDRRQGKCRVVGMDLATQPRRGGAYRALDP
jgi:hypothetical protein